MLISRVLLLKLLARLLSAEGSVTVSLEPQYMADMLRILLILFTSALAWSKPTNPYQDYIVDLLQKHGEKQVVVDTGGVGLKGNPARLVARGYDAKASKHGWTVEMELRVNLPDGQFTEYLTGIGSSESAARQKCLENFSISTFHVIYKAFLNPTDTHQDVYRFRQGKSNRVYVAGQLVSMGDGSAPRLNAKLETEIRTVVLKHPFGPGPHAVKVVYMPGVASSLTVDGQEQPKLADALKQLHWPKSAKPYMAKQFAVVH